MPKADHNPELRAEIESKFEAGAKRLGVTKQELARQIAKAPTLALMHFKVSEPLKARVESEAKRLGVSAAQVIRDVLERGVPGPTIKVRNAKG